MPLSHCLLIQPGFELSIAVISEEIVQTVKQEQSQELIQGFQLVYF